MTVVSFQYGFIFIKTKKTGGTSVEVELSKCVEPEAIVTPIYPVEPGHTARNFKRGFLRKTFYNHMPAAQIRKRLGAKTFQRLTKFCIEREPVSKCISHFHMMRNSPDHNTDNRYTKSWDEYCAAGDFPIDIDLYSEDVGGERQLLVDRVIPYERMKTDLPEFLQAAGVRAFSLDSRAKSQYSQNKIVSNDDVTPAQRARIYDSFASSLKVSGLDRLYQP